MKKRPPITVARRGQIIQRVMVDGWTSAAAAEFFGVPARLIDVWVADYRRNGMASLRRPPGQTIVAEVVQVSISQPVRTSLRRLAAALRRLFAAEARTEPLPLRRSNKDGSR
jgi:hypothetical protein